MGRGTGDGKATCLAKEAYPSAGIADKVVKRMHSVHKSVRRYRCEVKIAGDPVRGNAHFHVTSEGRQRAHYQRKK